jgi:hypothetical protein
MSLGSSLLEAAANQPLAHGRKRLRYDHCPNCAAPYEVGDWQRLGAATSPPYPAEEPAKGSVRAFEAFRSFKCVCVGMGGGGGRGGSGAWLDVWHCLHVLPWDPLVCVCAHFVW